MLMVASLALEKTRFLRVVANVVIKPSYGRSWLNLFAFSALFSAFLNNTAVVSSMLAPIRNNRYHAASKLLVPLSYAAILGGTLTLVGTSTNLIVNSMVLEAGMPSLGFFEFTKIGIFLVLSCGAVLLFTSRWLPNHTITQADAADYFIDMQVDDESPLIGRSIEENGLRNLESLFLVELIRNEQLISPVAPTEVLQSGDRLLFSGDIKKVTLLKQFSGLTTFATEVGLPLNNLSEVIVRPESVLVGKSLKRAGFRALFDAAVVAIKRDGQPVSGKLGDVVMQPGDYLVLAVGEDFKSRHNIGKNFYLISGVETEKTLSSVKEWFAVIGFMTAIALSALGVVPLFKGMLLLLGGLLLTNTLSANEVLQRLPVQIWLIISSALALSFAFSNTGVDQLLEQLIVGYKNYLSPFMLLLVIYIATWLLTELVTNNAAAALMLPIALSLASGIGIDPMAYIMAVAFGASASFVSPYGYQTNLMVFTAGQYRLLDFVKVGFPVAITYGVVAVAGINWFYL
jgi:di/tricarboxylate transporter